MGRERGWAAETETDGQINRERERGTDRDEKTETQIKKDTPQKEEGG